MKSLFVVLLITLSFSVQANEDHKYCSSIAGHAELIMQVRQAGVMSADVVYDKFAELKDSFEQPEKAMGLFSILIIEAYKEPIFQTDKFINLTVSEFKSEIYIDCMEVKSRQ